MYDITKTALNRAWRTGFGTIVRREDVPASDRYPEETRRARSRGSFRRLLPFGRSDDDQQV